MSPYPIPCYYTNNNDPDKTPIYRNKLGWLLSVRENTSTICTSEGEIITLNNDCIKIKTTNFKDYE